MRRLVDHIENRNKLLTSELQSIQQELQSVFQKKLLSAGVMQPGYFNDLISAGLTGWEESWYGGGRVWSTKEKFTDIESVKNYLLSYEWYDLK
jgi:hypothetical protein